MTEKIISVSIYRQPLSRTPDLLCLTNKGNLLVRYLPFDEEKYVWTKLKLPKFDEEVVDEGLVNEVKEVLETGPVLCPHGNIRGTCQYGCTS